MGSERQITSNSYEPIPVGKVNVRLVPVLYAAF